MANSKSRPGDGSDERAPWETDAPGSAGAGAPSTDVVEATVIESTGEVIPLGPASQAVIQWCVDRASVSDDDSAAAMEDMVRRVLASSTPDQVLSESLTVPIEDILGKPVQVTGIRVGESEFTEGFPFYALMDCVYGNPPESHVVTCGGFKVMAQLAAFDQMDAWPQVVVFKKSDKPTRRGFRPIQMIRPQVQ